MNSIQAVTFKAQIRSGRIVLDEPTDLPDGEIELVAVVGDELDDEDRRRLHAALDQAADDEQAGRMRDAADVLADLRRS